MNSIETPFAIRIVAILATIAVIVWMGFWVAGSVLSSSEVKEARENPATAPHTFAP